MSKSDDTPMSSSTSLDADGTGKPVNQTLYRGIIGSLLYLTASRPDIQFSVGMCARYQANPKESHMTNVKRILRYLIGTQELGIWYHKGTEAYLIAYTVSDHAGYKTDRKSTSGQCQFLGGCLVSWASKKQNCVSLSSTEAKYIAAASCCAQVLWLKQQLSDLDLEFSEIPILCDNTSTI